MKESYEVRPSQSPRPRVMRYAEDRVNERMWSMIGTCKKQDRNVFAFLQESIAAKLAGTPAPAS